jgi:hypothetical protein
VAGYVALWSEYEPELVVFVGGALMSWTGGSNGRLFKGTLIIGIGSGHLLMFQSSGKKLMIHSVSAAVSDMLLVVRTRSIPILSAYCTR